MNQEGPREVIIPEQKIISCSGCIHFSRNMVKSGFNPIYESKCNILSPPFGRRINEHPFLRYFVVDDECPFLKSFKRDETINKLL